MTALLCFCIAGRPFGGSTSFPGASSAMTVTPCPSYFSSAEISFLEGILDNSLNNAIPPLSSAVDVTLSSNFSTDIPPLCAENFSHVNTAQGPEMLSTVFNTTAYSDLLSSDFMTHESFDDSLFLEVMKELP